MQIANQGGGSYCAGAGDGDCSDTQYACKNYAAVNSWGSGANAVCCEAGQTCSSSVIGDVACVGSHQTACVSGGGHDATVCNTGETCCGYSTMTCCGAGTFCANNALGWVCGQGHCCPTGTTACARNAGWAYVDPVNCCTASETCDTASGTCVAYAG